MIGCYQDDFIDFLKHHLGDPVKVTPSNIIVRCPWCEWGTVKKHYHLHIGKNIPVFNCLRAGCNESGSIKKLIRKLTGGNFELSRFVDSQLIQNYNQLKVKKSEDNLKLRKFIVPPINRKAFPKKIDYLKYRFHYAPVNFYDIHGLILDPQEFFQINRIEVDAQLQKSIYYLQEGYVGFLLENHTSIVFRNINPNEKRFRFRKITLQKIPLLDYYKLSHNTMKCQNSNTVVISEGIFDIFDAHLFNYMGLTDTAYAFYCALSNKFSALLKSIAYFDNIYRPNVVILSDSNVKIEYYKRIRRFLKHLCNQVNVYYNISGGDFGDPFCSPEKFII